LTSLLGLWFLGLGVALRRRKCLAWLSKALALLVAWVSPLFGLLTALMRIRRSALNHKHDAADRAHGEFTWRLLRYVTAEAWARQHNRFGVPPWRTTVSGEL
jgi:hypothetical protein